MKLRTAVAKTHNEIRRAQGSSREPSTSERKAYAGPGRCTPRGSTRRHGVARPRAIAITAVNGVAATAARDSGELLLAVRQMAIERVEGGFERSTGLGRRAVQRRRRAFHRRQVSL